MSTPGNQATNDLETLLRTIYVLSDGNLDSTNENLGWVLELPAGRTLLDWFSRQISTSETTFDRKDDNLHARAALREICLERDEFMALEQLAQKKSSKLRKKDLEKSLQNYVTPSEYRQRTATLIAETSVCQEEIVYLKKRLGLTTKAAVKLDRTVEVLKDGMKPLNKHLAVKNERISYLSDSVDSCLDFTRSEALRLLETIENSRKTKPGQAASHEEEKLAHLSSTRDKLLGLLQDSYSSRSSELKLGPDNVEAEVEALLVRLDRIDLEEAQTGAYLSQLEELCEALERGESIGTDSQASPGDAERKFELVDARPEMTKAWNLNQVLFLQSQGETLTKVLEALPTHLLQPLESLHAELAEGISNSREAEVLIRALGQELDDLREDINFANRPIRNNSQDEAEGDRILQAQLSTLLSGSKGHCWADSNSLITLGPEDIPSEIRSLIKRAEKLRQEEKRWHQLISRTLQQNQSNLDDIMNVLYSNSTMNTSPPFRPSPDVEAIQKKGSDIAHSLSSEAAQLQAAANEIYGNETNLKRIARFIEQNAN